MGKLLRNTLKSRKGSYITEATIIAPLFILAVIALVGIIPVISMIENTVYVGADEIRQEAVLIGVYPGAKSCPTLFTARSLKEDRNLKHISIDGYYRGASHGDLEDLIIMDFQCCGGVYDPLSKFNDIQFSGKIIGRAYTGRYRKGNAASSFDDQTKVWVFPDEGIRYHKENCRHVHSSCRVVSLSADVRKSYHPCPNCKAKSASTGSLVYVFPRSGDAYHFGNCRAVKKYCIETTKGRAMEDGYTPCKTCMH